MAYLEVHNSPVFTKEIYKTEEEDYITAELENKIKGALLNNDVFLKALIEEKEKDHLYSKELEKADLLTVQENGIYYVKQAQHAPEEENTEGYFKVINHPQKWEENRMIFWHPCASSSGGYFNVLADSVWSGWKQIATSQEVNIGLNNKTDKNEYKVYTPYKEGENTEENPCDLYKLDRGSVVLPALVSVKNSPFLDNKARDATVFVPSRHFGWELLGEFRELFYQRFDWEGNPYGGWEQIAFASMISNPNLLINPDFRINQRGQTRYQVTNHYSVDRWMGWNTIVVPTEKGVTVSLAGSGYWEFSQTLEMPIQRILGRTLTGSVCVDDNVYFYTFSIPNTMPTSNVALGAKLLEEFHMRLSLLPEIGCTQLMFYDNHGATRHFSWAKLEFGSIPTAFVLPEPTIELMKCERYYYRIALKQYDSIIHIGNGISILNKETTNEFDFTLSLPVAMRKKPTLSAKRLEYTAQKGVASGQILSCIFFRNDSFDDERFLTLTVMTDCLIDPAYIIKIFLAGNYVSDGFLAFDAEIHPN